MTPENSDRGAPSSARDDTPDEHFDEDSQVCECGHVFRDHAERGFNYACCALQCPCTSFQGVAPSSAGNETPEPPFPAPLSPRGYVRQQCASIDELTTLIGASDWFVARRKADDAFDVAWHAAVHGLVGLQRFADSLPGPNSQSGVSQTRARDDGPRANPRENWRTRKPRIAETAECHNCHKPAPLVYVDEEVTWGRLTDGSFAATPVKIRSWFYRCETCPGYEPDDAHHEWYTVEASKEHEATVWRATMCAMSDVILSLRESVARLTAERDEAVWALNYVEELLPGDVAFAKKRAAIVIAERLS